MTRYSTLARLRDWRLAAGRLSLDQSSGARSLGTLGAGIGRFGGTLPVGIAFGPGETPALSLVDGLGPNRPSPDGAAPSSQSSVSRSGSTTLTSVGSGPRTGMVDRPTTPGRRSAGTAARSDSSADAGGVQTRVVSRPTDSRRTARLGPQTTVSRAESELSDDHGDTQAVDSPDADRPRTPSLPPLRSTATETDGETSDSASSLRSLGRFAAVVFRLARSVPAAGISTGSVRLAVRSFALRHGRPASAVSDRVRPSAGTDALTLRYEDAATEARSGGDGQDTDRGRASETTLDQLSTGTRSGTGSAVGRPDTGATDRGATFPETPPTARWQSGVTPDARESGSHSRETDDGVPLPVTETDGTARTATDDGDAPGNEPPPTLDDVGVTVNRDGSVEEPTLSAGTDRVLRRLYRDFERRLRTERRRRGM